MRARQKISFLSIPEVGKKQKAEKKRKKRNTPGTRGGPSGHLPNAGRKKKKKRLKIIFFVNKSKLTKLLAKKFLLYHFYDFDFVLRVRPALLTI